MATNLEKIGGVRPSGVQGNRKSPALRNNVNVQAPAQDKTPNRRFDASGIKGPGEALQAVGAAGSKLAEDMNRRNVAEQKAQLKAVTDQDDDDMAEILEEQKTARAKHFQDADLSNQDGIKKYREGVAEIDQQFAGRMDGRINEHRYKSKSAVDALQQDATTNGRINTLRDERNTTRGTNEAARIIQSYGPGADPNTYIEKLIEGVEIQAGSLEAQGKADIVYDALNFALQERMKMLQDPGSDPKLLDAFLKDPLTIKYMSTDFIKAGQAARKEQRDRRYANTPEGRAARSKEEEDVRFDAGLKDATKWQSAEEASGPNAAQLWAMRAELYYHRRGKTFPRTVLADGSSLVGAGGAILAENKPEPKVEIVPENARALVVENGQVNQLDIRGGGGRPNPGVLESDGSLTLAATKHLTALSFQSLPKSSDINGDEQGYTVEENNYMMRVNGNAVRILKEGAKNGMTTTEAHAQALLDTENRPEKFNFPDAGRKSYLNLKDEPDATMELTAEGLSQFNDDIQGHLNTAILNIKNLDGEEGVSPLDIQKATDIFSSFKKGWNTLMGNFSEGNVDLETERARLNYSLMARDFIRLFSLNPRFVVKEQVLLEKIFSGPSIFTNPAQAKVQIEFLRRELDGIVKTEFDKLGQPRKLDDKNAALDNLGILGRINRRLERFEAGEEGSAPKKGTPQHIQEEKIMAIEDASTLTEEQAIELGLQDAPEQGAEGESEDETRQAIEIAKSGSSQNLAGFSVPTLLDALSKISLDPGAIQDLRGALLALGLSLEEINNADISKK
jgi:hypothetical protein